MFDAIIQSFTQPPGSPWSASDMFTREEFLRKLVALTADGASVMGVQRSGRPLSEPRPGPIGNLAYSLAQAKEEFNEERLLTVWCAPHRLDLVAAKVERHPLAGDLLELVRRLSSHVATHHKAGGVLSTMHALFEPGDGAGAAGLSFAPHRFLSHAKPARVVCDCWLEIMSYASHVQRDRRDEAMFQWGQRVWATMSSLRNWLLLAGVADVLAVVRRANIQTQRTTLRLLEVDGHISQCMQDLRKYIAPGGAVRSALGLLSADMSEPGKGLRLNQVCRRVRVLKQNGTLTARCKGPDDMTRYKLDVVASDFTEVQTALGEIVAAVISDVESRFSNVGILRHVCILRPDWTQVEGTPVPCLSHWSQHFAVDQATLREQFDRVHAARLRYIVDNPASKYLAVDAFWPPLLNTQWSTSPELCRCIAAFIVLHFQNCDVERDIGIVKGADEAVSGQLGQGRLAARTRAILHLPEPSKKRGEPVTGVIRTIAKEWARQQNRYAGRSHTTLRGKQGSVPLRGRRGPEGNLVQRVGAEAMPSHDEPAAAVEEGVDMEALLLES